MICFNYYAANIKKSTPLGLIDLDRFIESIRNPKEHIKDIFSKIKEAELSGDMTLKAHLKEKLYSFTPCVVVSGPRKYDNIQSFTGLMMLDFDHLTSDDAKEFKAFLFDSYDFIIATWLSASGCGVRALVNIPVSKNVDEFKQYFMGLANEEMAQYKGFDFAPKNPVLPLFLSYDPNIYFGDTPGVWSKKYIDPVITPTVQYKYSENPSRIEKLLVASIDKIHDNGHPQLRAAAYALGGYVGAGYIEFDHAISLINDLIRSNHYLSIKPDVYIKTANTMILKGLKNPLYL